MSRLTHARPSIAALALVILAGCSEPFEPTPIEGATGSAPALVGGPASPQPVDFSLPPHPYMSRQGVNAMHSDGYSSDVHPSGGPLGGEYTPQFQGGQQAAGRPVCDPYL